MTAALQAVRDRLLQAVDSQSNISNMVVVLDVISFLEKYPITKEALEETRLGKLINDVRRKTKNEDLAKRVKKLLRTWQKLIEPGSGQSSDKTNNNNASWSHSGSHSHTSNISTSNITDTRKTVCELKSRNDFNNSNIMDQSNRKRKGEKTEPIPAKLSKTKHNLKQLSMNRHKKPLSTSLLLKASVVQAATRGQYSTTLHQETVKKTTIQVPKTVRQEDEEVRTVKNNADNLKSSSCSLDDPEKKRNSEKSKDRKLIFDPITCQLKNTKDLDQEDEPKPSLENNEVLKNPSNSFHHTDWKELSRIESIKSYLNQQSNVLSSMSHTPSTFEDDQNTHKLLKEEPTPTDLPGVNREVTKDDVDRLHGQQWSGVNGCFDNKGAWFDWTRCISLDLHSDGSRLDILPYVCLD